MVTGSKPFSVRIAYLHNTFVALLITGTFPRHWLSLIYSGRYRHRDRKTDESEVLDVFFLNAVLLIEGRKSTGLNRLLC